MNRVYELEGSTITHYDTDQDEAIKLLAKNAKYFADQKLQGLDIRKKKRAYPDDRLGHYNPFKLVTLARYNQENPAKFQVLVNSSSLVRIFMAIIYLINWFFS